MKQSTLDILGLGSACVDDFLVMESFPERGMKIDVLSAQRQGGGLTGSALVAASRLGCKCGLVIRLGGDDISAFIRQSLTKEGIVLYEQPGGEGFAPYHSIIIVERGSGERTILCKPPHGVDPQTGAAEFALLDAVKCLFVDYIYAPHFLSMVDKARAMGLPVVGDFEKTADRTLELMALVDHLIVPLHYAREVTGAATAAEAAEKLAAQPGRTLACVTDSERGCWFAENGGGADATHVPAFPVARLVDTTGCGDVFHGAYAACLVQGYPPAECVRRAAAAAALKAGKVGAQQGSPFLAELEAFLSACAG